MKTAMILAAGRGERLKPITNFIPKALCRVKGRPLIEHHILKLAQAGVKKIVINHAYLGDQLRTHLGFGERWNIKIYYSPEPPGGLETGGGIVNALPLLGDEPFITVNSDIFTDFNFGKLIPPKSTLAHLIMVENPPHNPGGDFGLLANQLLSNENKSHTYPGIACFLPDAFKELPYGRYSIVNALLRPLASKNLLSGEIYNGLWMDIGSEARLNLANFLP